MSTHGTAAGAREKAALQPYSLAAGEGDARWVLGELDAIKATAQHTAGTFGVKESRAPKGSGPPLHVHEHEDEACYVLEGEVTFLVGDNVVPASRGAFVYLPRRVPHSLRVESDQATTLWLVVPGEFVSFFADTFPAVNQNGDPASAPPSLEQMTEAAARYGVTILGPPLGSSS